MNRGVYRIAHPVGKFAQYREAVLWAQASHHSPKCIALSRETALLLYGVSDLNSSRVHLTVPKTARFRRECPARVTIYRADLTEKEIGLHEGIPVKTVSRSISAVLSTTHRTDIAPQAITEPVHDGLLNSDQAKELRKLIKSNEDAPSPSTRRKDTGHEFAIR